MEVGVVLVFCFVFLFFVLCCAHYLIVIIIITIYILDYGDGTKIGSAKVADLVGVKNTKIKSEVRQQGWSEI